jgi:hypothetical protein
MESDINLEQLVQMKREFQVGVRTPRLDVVCFRENPETERLWLRENPQTERLVSWEPWLNFVTLVQAADTDGSCELDPAEFVRRLGCYFGNKLSGTALAQLFMKIDADCGGTISW